MPARLAWQSTLQAERRASGTMKRGRHADHALQIAGPGWKDVLWRTYRETRSDRLTWIAGGVAFFVPLAIFPAIAAVVSGSGLFFSVRDHQQDRAHDQRRARAPSRLPSGHRNHVAVEIGDDPDGAGDNEKDDKDAEREGQNIVRAVGSAAQMQKEDEVDADLRQGEYDQPDRDARGPEQIGLRHDERRDRRRDSERQPHGVRQIAGRRFMLFDPRRSVREYVLVIVGQ
jgi:hypothetical protein